jgi:hypothetical protein
VRKPPGRKKYRTIRSSVRRVFALPLIFKFFAETTVSAKSTPEENFTKLIELYKAKGPVPFRPTQRDYKRQEKLVSVDSLSNITFDDGLFKDEADLNGFLRWILRFQAKREAGTLEP